MKRIRFLIDWRDTKKGECVNYSDKDANEMVSMGYAEFVSPDAKKIDIKENMAKEILDKWAIVVVPKEAIYIDKEGINGINQDKCLNYGNCGYREDLVLWIPPKDCLRLEFEDTPDHNHRYILELESAAKSLGFDYCITGHNGKSDYFNMFQIKDMPLNEDNKIAKMLLLDMMMPAIAKDQLDRTNLGWTLSPIIEHQHWKTKYNGNIHKMLRGKSPIEHKNKYPEKLLKQIRKTKEAYEKNKTKWVGKNDWVRDFLINYCCQNPLPKGSRHFIIEKNLAALIIFDKDKEQIKGRYYKAQERTHDSMRSWERRILSGEYNQVFIGEIAKYIKEHGLNYQIPQIEEKDIDKNIEPPTIQNSVLMFLAQGGQDKIRKATEMIVNETLKTEKIYTLKDDNKTEIWIYNQGIYVPQGISHIKNITRQILGEAYTLNIANEVISKIAADTFIDAKEFFKEQNIKKIAVKNGILDIETREISPFSNNYFFFNKLPINYIPNKDCPSIKKHFVEVLPNQEDTNIIQEIFGYLIYRDQPMEKAFMFCGFGRNGKGKTLSLMKSFLGIENVANIQIQQLDSDLFSMGELCNKLANLGGDISKTALKETGNFKCLTGRDLISAPRKFLSRMAFVNYAKMIFCANDLPVTYDLSDAFFNRWILIDFPYKFLKKGEIEQLKKKDRKKVKLADIDIIDKITTEDELSGLLNWALDGLDRLLKQKDFSFSKTTEETKKIWLRKSDSFIGFCMDEIKEVYDGKIIKAELRKAYSLYCKKHRLRPISDKGIHEVLTRNYGVSEERDRQEGKQITYWEGICFKNGMVGMDGIGFSINTHTRERANKKKPTINTTLTTKDKEIDDNQEELIVEDVVRDISKTENPIHPATQMYLKTQVLAVFDEISKDFKGGLVPVEALVAACQNSSNSTEIPQEGIKAIEKAIEYLKFTTGDLFEVKPGFIARLP